MRQMLEKSYAGCQVHSATCAKKGWGDRHVWTVVGTFNDKFNTIKERDEENSKRRRDMIAYLSNGTGRISDSYNISFHWPETSEEFEIRRREKEEELLEEQKVLEENARKRKRMDEEDEVAREISRKIVKHENRLSYEEFKQSVRNGDVINKVRDIWKEELERKGKLLIDNYPFKNKDLMIDDMNETIPTLISGIVPHVSSSDLRRPFFGSLEFMFPKTNCHINDKYREVYGRSCFCEMFDFVIKLYNRVHKDPEACTLDDIKMYANIFEVEVQKKEYKCPIYEKTKLMTDRNEIEKMLTIQSVGEDYYLLL